MADYFWFGGAPGVRTVDGYTVGPDGERVAGAVVTVTDAETGLTLTDLLDESLTPVTEVTSGVLGYVTFAARVPIVDVFSGSETFRMVSSTALEDVLAIAGQAASLAASSAAAQASAEASAATVNALVPTVEGKINTVAANAAFAMRAPDWGPSRSYVVGELTVYLWIMYRCTVAHTASATFDSAKFTALSGGAGSGASEVSETFSLPGTVITGTGGIKWYNPTDRALTLVSVRASVTTAPTGSSLIVDVNKGGTTIFTTQANRPTIAASGFTAMAGAAQVTSLAVGQYLTVDVDQIGSVIAGAHLTIQVVYA